MERLLEGNADVEGCHLLRKQKKETGGLIGGFLYEEYWGSKRGEKQTLCMPPGTKKNKRSTENVPQNSINNKQSTEDINLSVWLKQLK